MKKFLSLLLAILMIFSMSAVMSACSEDENLNNVVDRDEVDFSKVFPETLSKQVADPIGSLSNTGWQLAGGMIEGIEMEQADLDSLLEAAGGSIQYVFTDDKSLQMVTPLNSLEGSYSLVNDSTVVHMVFPEIEYYGIITNVSETIVLMIADPKQPGSALYLSQIEEG